MLSAYANVFGCSLPIFLPLRNHFLLCITFHNAKLNIIGDRGSPCFNPVLFSKKDDGFLLYSQHFLSFVHILHIFINYVGILNSFIHFHSMYLCTKSIAFWKSINKYCTLWLYSQIFSFIIFGTNMLSITHLSSLNPFC
jgi:hypothetical protein